MSSNSWQGSYLQGFKPLWSCAFIWVLCTYNKSGCEEGTNWLLIGSAPLGWFTNRPLIGCAPPGWSINRFPIGGAQPGWSTNWFCPMGWSTNLLPIGGFLPLLFPSHFCILRAPILVPLILWMRFILNSFNFLCIQTPLSWMVMCKFKGQSL